MLSPLAELPPAPVFADDEVVDNTRASSSSAVGAARLCGRGSYGTCLVSHDLSLVWKLVLLFNLSRSHPDRNGFEATTTREIALVNFNSTLQHQCIIRCLETTMEPLQPQSGLQRVKSEPMARVEPTRPLRHQLLKPPDNVQVRMTLDYGGINLWDWIRGGALAEQDPFVPWILYQLLHVLATLEPFQIVHNDLKPWNIVIDPVSRNVRVIDWGSAVFDSQRIQFDRVYRTLLCTLEYASPEMHPHAPGQGPRGPIHPWNDVFSLGMTMLSFIHRHFPDQTEVVKFMQREPRARHMNVWHMENCDGPKSGSRRVCNRPEAVRKTAPRFYEAIPLLERMLTLDPQNRPLASEVIASSYFDGCRGRLTETSELVQRIKHPACDEPLRLHFPEVDSLFVQHPQLNARIRAAVLLVMRQHAKVLKWETSLTLSVSLLDRCLFQGTGLAPVSIETYKVLAFASMFVASDLRFNNVPWLDWYTLTQENLSLHPPSVLTNGVRWLMDSLNYDLWTLTFDSLPLPDQVSTDWSVVQAVMERFPLVERTQVQLNAKYCEMYASMRKKRPHLDDEPVKVKAKVKRERTKQSSS